MVTSAAAGGAAVQNGASSASRHVNKNSRMGPTLAHILNQGRANVLLVERFHIL
jgi:hypothetical protein